MDYVIKKKWIIALRSRQYKQGKGALRTTKDEFCCLGVLCDIIDPSKWVSPEQREASSLSQDKYSYGDTEVGFWSLPPSSVLENIGLFDNLFAPLIRMNDSGDSFEQIADYIEMNC